MALVTGASSDIGKEAALAPVATGFDVVGTSRDTSRVTPLDGVTFLDLDVASDASAAAAVREMSERFGRIDVLVDNAGVGSLGATEETSVEHVRPSSTRTSSGFINISSVLGFLPQPYMAACAASQHATGRPGGPSVGMKNTSPSSA